MRAIILYIFAKNLTSNTRTAMRKGFIVVVCIVISVLVWAGQSSRTTSSVKLPKVYPYYLLDNGDLTFGLGLNFKYNTFCDQICTFNQGTWEVVGDTLYVYAAGVTINTHEWEYIESHPDSISPYWFFGPPYFLRKDKMARFVITAGGDSLIGIISDEPFVGTPSSVKDAALSPGHHEMIIGFYTRPVIHYDCADGVRWVKIPSPDLCGVFDVRRIDRADDFTLVVAEKDSMTYYIAAAPGEGQWVEDVRVGSKVPLRLSRFEADRHPRSVTSYPDSIYVMYYDVYGYWDAEWCEECRKMDNDRGSYYKRMLDSIVEARPVRQDTIWW